MLRFRGISIDGVTLSATQVRAIYRDVHATARRSHRVRWCLFVVALLLVLLTFGGLVGLMAPRLVRLGAYVGASPLASGVAIGALLGGLMATVIRFALGYGFALMFRTETREAMQRLGYALCLNCGYWLKGIGSSPKCPECGTPVGRNQRGS